MAGRGVRALMQSIIGSVILVACLAGSGFAETSSKTEISRFRFGQNCSGLGSVSVRELESLIQNHNSSQYRYFCRPETYFDCYDYQPFLRGKGKLSVASDGFFCQFKPIVTAH